jgi:hypothetical protein
MKIGSETAIFDPESTPQGVAEAHLRDGRWNEAAAALDTLPDRDSSCEFRLRLARNLAELAEHRPNIYRILMEALPDAQNRYAIVRGKGGRWTLAATAETGRQTLSRGGDPVLATVQTLAEIKSTLQKGTPMSICGIGDGYVLSALAGFSPKLPLGRQQVVFIIEPDARLALTALLLHDFAGPNGAIRQGRFRWFIGQNWAKDFEQELQSDLFLQFPENHVCQSSDYAAIEAIFQKTLNRLLELDRESAQRSEEIYSGVTGQSLAELFGENPPRPPRVMIITSRFTTVLQYSSADAAEALANLGWQTKKLIEPTAHHALRKLAMRQTINDFKPDLVLCIDHHRAEYDGVFPKNLPFACWIQDHLPNLCKQSAGPKIGMRDFVMTALGTHFIQQYQYPARQIVDLPNLARSCRRPATWKCDGPDLVYISNWSRTTEEIVGDLLAQTNSPPELHSITEKSIGLMLGVYERGEWLATQSRIRELIHRAQKQCGTAISDPNLLDDLVNLLWNRLNNHLYRHQALQWVIDLAEQKKLDLSLYGKGWENHPRLARFARGFVKPGADLEDLVRRSKINLQLEPFPCFTHPRLLSGVFAGGFFIVRDHPFCHRPQKLLNFLAKNFDSEVKTTEQARANIQPDRRDDLEAILTECADMGEQADIVQMARNWQRAGLLKIGGEAMVRLPEISFDDPRSLREKIERFLSDERLRLRTATAIREDLESRLSYEAGLARAARKMGKILRTEPCA